MSNLLLKRFKYGIVTLPLIWINYLRNAVLAKVWQKLLACYKNAFAKILYMCIALLKNVIVIVESIIVIGTSKIKIR
jgi:hypothetical protein